MADKNSRLFISRSWQALAQKLLAEIESEKKEDALKPVAVLAGSLLLARDLELKIYPRICEKGLGVNVRFMLLPELMETCFYGPDLPGYKPEADKNLRYLLLKDMLRKLPAEHYFGSVKTASGLAETIIAEAQDLKDGLIIGERLSRVRKELKGAKFDALFEILDKLDGKLEGFEQDWQKYLAAINNARKYPGLLAADKIFIYGFYDYTAIQRELVRAVCGQVRVDAFMVKPENETYSGFAEEVFLFYQKQLGLKPEKIDIPMPGTDLGKFKNSLNADAPETIDGDGSLSLIFAPGIEREAVEVCREIMRLVRVQGLKFNEIGVLLRDSGGYRKPLTQAFDHYGIPYYLPAGAPISDSSPVRTLGLMLKIPQEDENFSRRSVIKFLSSHALRKDVFSQGDPGVSRLFDIVSREAFIVNSSGEWRERLEDYMTALQGRRERAKSKINPDDDEDSPRVQKIALLEKKISAGRELLEITSRLFPELESLLKAKSYGAIAEQVKELAGQYLDFSGNDPGADDPGLKEKVDEALDEITGLDRGRTAADYKTFLEIFSREISGQALERGGFRQEGVCIADIMSARGVCFKAVIVPGLCEGSFPLKPSESPHLSDQERETINKINQPEGVGLLPLKWRQNLEERLLFYLACEQADQFLILTCPWLELASNKEQIPSYLLINALVRLLGKEVTFENTPSLHNGRWVRYLGLDDAAPGSAELAVDADDYELYLLKQVKTADCAHLGKNRSLRRVLELAGSRWLDNEPGVYEGNIGGKGFSPGDFSIIGRNISASGIQKFYDCPFKYFVGYVLEVEQLDDPETLWEFENLAQGSILHKLLELVFSNLKTPKEIADPELFKNTLRKICRDDGKKYLKDNYPQARNIFDLELRELGFYLEKWHQELLPAPEHKKWLVEKYYQPQKFDLQDGRSVNLTGKIDRIDLAQPQESACVIDYKRTKKLPTKMGMIQLPIYLLAAANLFGIPEKNLKAKFLSIAPEGLHQVGERAIHGEHIERHLNTLRMVVKKMADYIENGRFIPSLDGNCARCDYRGACYDSSTAYRGKKRNRFAEELSELARAVDFSEKKAEKQNAEDE